jgi:hypothetical protein
LNKAGLNVEGSIKQLMHITSIKSIFRECIFANGTISFGKGAFTYDVRFLGR